jgi:hypothetical protein
MKKEQIVEIIEKLIGSIEPVGDASIDGKREENLKVFIGVFEDMLNTLDNISYENRDFHQVSIKNSVALCDKALRDAAIDSKPHEELMGGCIGALEMCQNIVMPTEQDLKAMKETLAEIINNAKS